MLKTAHQSDGVKVPVVRGIWTRWGAFVICIFLLSSVVPRAWSAEPGSLEETRSEILSSLIEQFGNGYQNEDIGLFLSAYDDGAEIVNYVYGRMDTNTLREKTLEDFGRISGQEVRLEIQEITPEKDGFVVLLLWSVKGNLDGKPMNRHDRYYLLVKKSAEKWKIFRQSYREDFGITEFPHLGK